MQSRFTQGTARVSRYLIARKSTGEEVNAEGEEAAQDCKRENLLKVKPIDLGELNRRVEHVLLVLGAVLVLVSNVESEVVLPSLGAGERLDEVVKRALLVGLYNLERLGDSVVLHNPIRAA